jgi:hypothetical protein
MLAGDLEAALGAAAERAPAADDEDDGSVTELVRRYTPLADLCVFAIGDELFRLRAALGLAIR